MIGPALVAGLLAASAPAAGQTPCRFDEAEKALANSKFREAAAGFRKCQDAGRRQRNASTLARGLIGESNALRSLGGLQESRALAQLGLEAARSAADPELLALAHEAIGDASYALRLYEPALQSFRAALPLWRRAGNTMAEVADLKNIGIAHLSLRQIDQALLYLEEASRKDPEAGQGALAVSILGNLGTAYWRVGAHRSALEKFEEALRVAERLRSPVEIHDVLTRLGWLHLSLGFPDAALHDFRRGLTFDSAAPHGHRVWLREGLAGALEATGNLEEARQEYEQLLTLYRRAKDATGVTYSLNGLATQESRLDPRRARLLFQEALETSRGAEGRFAWDAWRGLARLDRRAGDLDRAVAEYDEAFRAFLAFRQALAEPRARALVSSSELASELLEALAERGGTDDARRAFEVFEQSHGRVLLETLRARRKGEVEKEPDASLLGLQARAADLRRRLVAPETPSAEGQQLLDELLRVEAAIDERLFSDRGRRSEPPVDVATVEQVQTLLGPHRALLAYALGPNRLLGIVLTHRTLSIRLLDPTAEDLSRRISVFLDLVGESPSEGWKAVSRQLYDTLVGPFAEDLSGAIDTLVIVPDGPLAFLPFDTLLGPTTGGERHLLERYRIFSVPSATVLRELTRPSSGTGSAGTLVVAGPDTVSAGAAGLAPLAKQARRIYAEQGLGLKPLAHVLSEARQVLDIAGPPAQLLSGASATEEAFRAMPLARYQVFHFATHGLLSERAPERSALVLIPGPSGEQDGYLQAREIAQLHLGAELVVLSACRSSRGRLVAGEGAEGLARAFLQAGARSVVASLWDVEDAPTEALMSSFYRHLTAGEAKADALRAAKLERIGQKSSSARHWAAFVLFGDGLGTVKLRGPVRPARGPDARLRTFLLVALGAAALAAGFLILRHRA